ncbi:hypothetical protein A5690_01825 [Mycobacterium intracellulare]|uniref:DUF732 domain-containing protein n=1 Tax=Mycobacterium intracellulare TaxID=1767 RepID=UPI0007EAF979|nr:DUF732 domain-containing protein [Mycobacterium intracellulare]OBH45166.1 hypothetical protein A5690_01825 [Mycobacterium intracellulare]
MKALARTHQWIWVFRHQPLTIRLLAAAAGLLTVASAFAAPAEAEGNGDDFIDALNHAGIDFGEPGNAMAVGESICPMLSQPGGSFAAAASSISGRGMSPQMASMFTTIAIQTYCPQEMANIASGNLSGAMPQVPGMPGQIPGMGGQIPGMAGQIPGMAGQVPGMTGQIPGMTGQMPGQVPALPSY